ncbi:MAG TPA: (S)-ureidoglycine aminohydrolase [Acidobacteriaceae bacterium]|nr:(S)-ureidoglycine aminohydrolase [Acidobacteriaceae bacterium]
MFNLGNTRSDRQPTHLLQTPDTFVGSPLPGYDSVTVIVHTAPAAGAAFTQYTAEFETGGSLGPAHGQRFLYVLEGAVSVFIDGKTHSLPPGGYGHIPANQQHTVTASEKSRVAVIEKPVSALLNEAAAAAIFGKEDSVTSQPLGGDTALQVKQLLPTIPGLDYAVNTMCFEPGASLAQVEIHVMEHGLLILEGSGIYRLANSWYPVQKGDFIWMAPYCPQWFGAIGKTQAKYLIYKDWNRHPLPGR